ncbi:TatD family hydrolase [Dehalobacter sp. DCM]|uniref:TatD family hydrolase n=1 Tax=Dehalobacter sp. DCM TaxID=2907827 RepID=UPI003081C40E|nr:TatD family hydrolase [Dehalobacter sp. DCM]
MMWDTHAHLDDEQFDQDRDAVIQRALGAGITTLINVGCSAESSEESVKLAGRYPFVYAAVGIHPHEAKTCTQETWDRLATLARDPKVVAWGEIGLDYYRDISPREDQKRIFIQQLKLANDADLPVIIHNRDAHGDILQIIKEFTPKAGCVFHTYSGSWEMAKVLLDMDFYLSFSGPITFKNARHGPEVIAKMPVDRLLAETDCPYLTPEPFRGKRNEPAHVSRVIAKIADIRGLDYEETVRICSENASRFFKLRDVKLRDL